MNRSLPLEPVSLAGARVRLDPLEPGHLDALCSVGLDASLWDLAPLRVTTREDMSEYISAALRERDAGRALPFVTVKLPGGKIVGCTRFGNYAPEHLRVEIGWTWLEPSAQGSGLNTEAKYLMLRHAFEQLKCRRVEFKTDVNNARSRAALRKIGAREEGLLRAHMQTGNGRSRDTVYSSIIASEWPSLRLRLEGELREK